MKKTHIQSFISPLLRCCLLYRSRPAALDGTKLDDDEYDDGDGEFLEEEDEETTFPFLSRKRDGSLQVTGKNKQESSTTALQAPNTTGQFRRRYTLATPSFGGLSSSLPNGTRGLATFTSRNKALTAETSSTVSDDETIRTSIAKKESVSASPVRNRSDTPRSFTATVSRGHSSSSSVSDWTGGMDSVRGVGRLSAVLDFTLHTSKLSITMSKIEFPPYQQRDLSLLEVSVMLLPGKRQSFRAKPKDFNDPVAIYLYPKDKVKDMSLRFRLYEQGAVGSKHLLGEGNLRLKSINLDSEMIPVTVDLQPPGSYVPEAASGAIMYEGELAISEEDRPEILLSLEYRRLTGKLLLEVIKTRKLGMLTDSKAREMYVDVKLIGREGDLMSKGKTTPRRHMVDPEYNEMFLFHVPEQELNSVTVLITIVSVSKKLGRKFKVGRVALGQNYSSEEELRHWYEMTRTKEKSIVRWHRINEISSRKTM